jgi:hypothetical protein
MSRIISFVIALLLFSSCQSFSERGVTVGYSVYARCQSLVFVRDNGGFGVVPDPWSEPRPDWIYVVYTIERIDHPNATASAFTLLPEHLFIPERDGSVSSSNRATRDGWAEPVPPPPNHVVVTSGSSSVNDVGFVIMRYSEAGYTAERLLTAPPLGQNSLGYERNAPEQPVFAYAVARTTPVRVEPVCDVTNLPRSPLRRLY